MLRSRHRPPRVPQRRHYVIASFRHPAFSLFELVIVMSITAIIAAVAIPRYGQAIARYRADAAARRIAADLARTRQLARASSAARTIEFRLGANTYYLAAETDLANGKPGSLVALAEEPYHATLVSADFGGDGTVGFNGFGIPDSGGTVVLRVGSAQRTIAMDAATGATTITDP